MVKTLLSCLDDPQLPLLQWQECMAVLATRLPKDLKSQARHFLISHAHHLRIFLSCTSLDHSVRGTVANTLHCVSSLMQNSVNMRAVSSRMERERTSQPRLSLESSRCAMPLADHVLLLEVLNLVAWDYLGSNMILNVTDVLGEIPWEGPSDSRSPCGASITFD